MWWVAPITPDTIDPSSREVHVVEAYVMVDYDRDGIAEWRKITKIGKNVLDNEDCGWQPFVAFSPIPQPHKFYGKSLADVVMDLQFLKSQVMRAMLDSFAFNINPAKAVNFASLIDPNDLLNTNPGNWVRLRGDVNNSIMQLPTSGVGAEAFQLLDYIDNTAESRSGVSKSIQGIDTNAFNKTAAGTQMIMTESQQTLALMVYIFAESIGNVYKKILKNANQYIKEPQLIPLGKQFLQIDPSQWTDIETFTVNVGSGALDKQADTVASNQILQMQQTLLGAGKPELMAMVDPMKIFNSGSSILRSLGKKNIQDFFNQPGSQEYQGMMQHIQQSQQPPPPDPSVQATQIMAAQQAQAAQQSAMIKSAEFELRVREEDREYELKREKMILDYEIELAKLHHKFNESELDAVTQGVGHQLDIATTQNTIQQSQMDQIAQSGFGQQGQQEQPEPQQPQSDPIQNAHLEALTNIGHGIHSMMQHMAAPKQIQRDANGNLIGIGPANQPQGQ
jgi:hypothetical protein